MACRSDLWESILFRKGHQCRFESRHDIRYQAARTKRTQGEMGAGYVCFSANNSLDGQGGLILIKLSRVLYSNINQIALVMRYELPSDEASQHSNSVAFQLGEVSNRAVAVLFSLVCISRLRQNVDNFYQSSDVRKAILLARYVLLLQSWSLDAR